MREEHLLKARQRSSEMQQSPRCDSLHGISSVSDGPQFHAKGCTQSLDSSFYYPRETAARIAKPSKAASKRQHGARVQEHAPEDES